ncbi:aldo/keto reductase [Tichowtungia aerotolerans]|uniref:Aldo/keto reductase n=1 Tax=Tichowtungia aerotolerans TaxID=2697043 RepID=A0A6P1M907_9BACT|nr:aldo/keto reductase [Tichowtungia aerotolerans]QHI69024.1 aldo/keto reductase [Tichowtungia aerotolerans]
MIYRTYGKTGKEVSAIGFGGMRFPQPENIEKNAELVLYAHSKGITYFDTAPGYCDDRSEEIMGAAFRQMAPGSFVVSTKCGSPDGEELRKSLERSLERLGVDCIDFFNIWCVKSQADWESRKKGGAVDALLKARDEGLVKHVVCSTHMTRDEAAGMFAEKNFEGVTLGYNAVNFPFREQVISDAAAHEMGVVVMNPLNGGLIPQHAARFDFIRAENDPDVVHAGLRFVLSNSAVTVALVGFGSREEIDASVAVTENFVPHDEAHHDALKKQITDRFDGFCTGCGYCVPCPQGIRIPRMMDAYNMRILAGPQPEHITNRLKWHWSMTANEAETCTQCGACEAACTQHLPIIERLKEISAAGREAAQAE